MMSHTASNTVTEHRDTAVPAEVNNTAYVPNYNETDYSDFLYLAPPLSSEFLPLEPTDDKTARPIVKKAKIRPAETFNTGTTPPPATPAEEKPYAKATFPPVAGQSDDMEKAAERRERRPSFVEVTPVKVHHEHDNHKDAHGHHHHAQRRRSSQESEPMGWWPENETIAQHEWVEQNEEEDIIEDDVWSDAFYE